MATVYTSLSRPLNPPRPGDFEDRVCAIALIRPGSGLIDVWSLRLQDSLPIILVPLRSPDPDVVLELPQVMADIYDIY